MEKAYVYYKQALEKGLSLSIDAYHAILKTTSSLKPNIIQKWESIEVSLFYFHLLGTYLIICFD